MINEGDFNLALNSISNLMLKVLKINIITGKYNIIKIDDRELPKSERAKKNIFAWADEFMEERNVVESVFEFHRLMYNQKYLQEYFSKNNFLNVKYKRKCINGEYKWAELQVNKIDNEWVYLYVIDINNRFSEELDLIDKKYENLYIDSETGFKNENGLKFLIDRFNNRKVGMMYIKLNDDKVSSIVKYATSVFSHGYYRASEREFYIICNDYGKQRFNVLADTFVSLLKNDGVDFIYNKLWEDRYDSLPKLLDTLKN